MIAGIDLGGTRVRIAFADDDGRVRRHTRTATDRVGGVHGFAGWVASELARLHPGERVRALAVGAPGPVDQVRGVLVNPPNLPGWSDAPLVAMLEEVCGCPVRLENDANLAGWGEYRRGAGRGARSLVYVTWSTGVGAGLVLDGHLLSGAHGSAGEVGHMIIDPDGPLDGCGQRGCVEAFCGGRRLLERTGRPAQELFEAAARGDQQARAAVADAAHHMGIALINLVNILDPDLIVIGGGVTRSWGQVAPELRRTLRSSPFIRPARRPPIRRARLGDGAGLVGAVEWARAAL